MSKPSEAGALLRPVEAGQAMGLPPDRDTVIEFLKTLQVLPPGTTALVVDERHRPRMWPPSR